MKPKDRNKLPRRLRECRNPFLEADGFCTACGESHTRIQGAHQTAQPGEPINRHLIEKEADRE